jgi:hypothetical protein
MHLSAPKINIADNIATHFYAQKCPGRATTGHPSRLARPNRDACQHGPRLSQSSGALTWELSTHQKKVRMSLDKDQTKHLLECQSSAVDSWHARGSTWCWRSADANTSTPLSLRQSPPRHWVMQKRNQLSCWWEKENQEVIGQRQDKAPGGVTSKCCRWAIAEMGALGLGICSCHHC